MTNQLALTNVINVSVISSPAGINAFNTSNLALFTGDSPGTTGASIFDCAPSFVTSLQLYGSFYYFL